MYLPLPDGVTIGVLRVVVVVVEIVGLVVVLVVVVVVDVWLAAGRHVLRSTRFLARGRVSKSLAYT